MELRALENLGGEFPALQAASKLGTLAARVEGKLAEDLAAPVAYILADPCRSAATPQLGRA